MEIKDYIDKKLVHSIHTSERRSWRSCRRRWNWAYNEMYYPKVTPKPLEFGVAFHKAMEFYYEPSMWGISVEAQQGLALKTFRDECDAQLKRYKRLHGEPEVDVIEDYKARIELGLNMIKFYTETVSPYYDLKFKPVEVEVAFEVALKGPQGDTVWCKCDQCWKKWFKTEETSKEFNEWQSNLDLKNAWESLSKRIEHFRSVYFTGLPVTYGGRLDMLAQDDIDRFWIFDWKTTSRMLNEGTEEAFLELDDQIASYCWALREYGIPVAGFVYVEIKKAYPKPPEPLTRPYKGKLFSTNKQNLTTYNMAKNTFISEDPDAFANGLYDDYLLWLKEEGPKFHQRHQIHKNDHELDEIGKNIYLEALDMVGNPRVYPMPGRFSCGTCLFRQPCLGVNQGEDYLYTLDSLFEKHEKHYYEEVEPSTD